MELADAGSFFVEWSGQRVATEHCLAKAIMRFWHSGFSVASGSGSWSEHVSAIKVAGVFPSCCLAGISGARSAIEHVSAIKVASVPST